MLTKKYTLQRPHRLLCILICFFPPLVKSQIKKVPFIHGISMYVPNSSCVLSPTKPFPAALLSLPLPTLVVMY